MDNSDGIELIILDSDPVEGLDQRHKIAAELLLRGQKTSEVARKVGVHPDSIWRWLNREDFNAYMDRIKNQRIALAERILFHSATDAARNIVELLGCDDNKLRFRASQDVLDRSGIGSTTTVQHTGPGGGPIQAAIVDLSHMTVEQLRAHRRALQGDDTDDQSE